MAFFSLNRDGPDTPGLADPIEVQLFVLKSPSTRGSEAAWVCLAFYLLFLLLITLPFRAAVAIVFTVFPW